jgi:hypothetical protein
MGISFPFLFFSMRTSEAIPDADRKILKDAYDAHPGKISKMDAETFVDEIAWRLYTEWCCNSGESGARHHFYGYERQPYHHWVNDETHYALEGAQVDQAKYQQVRTAILRGIVSRAVELFSEWDRTNVVPQKDDKRNLRASLKPYLS